MGLLGGSGCVGDLPASHTVARVIQTEGRVPGWRAGVVPRIAELQHLPNCSYRRGPCISIPGVAAKTHLFAVFWYTKEANKEKHCFLQLHCGRQKRPPL